AVRVAVVDLDAHHGDGTQAALSDDRDALYISIHESGLFPADTGRAEDVGIIGNMLNMPLMPGAGDAELLAATALATEAIRVFSPEIIILLFGTDGHVDDPMSNLTYSTAGYVGAVSALRQVAEEQ
ncbi:MAG: hypothetical protein WC655_24220, partial [Candidatus Hydrogenedentales bacterium]